MTVFWVPKSTPTTLILAVVVDVLGFPDGGLSAEDGRYSEVKM